MKQGIIFFMGLSLINLAHGAPKLQPLTLQEIGMYIRRYELSAKLRPDFEYAIHTQAFTKEFMEPWRVYAQGRLAIFDFQGHEEFVIKYFYMSREEGMRAAAERLRGAEIMRHAIGKLGLSEFVFVPWKMYAEINEHAVLIATKIKPLKKKIPHVLPLSESLAIALCKLFKETGYRDWGCGNAFLAIDPADGRTKVAIIDTELRSFCGTYEANSHNLRTRFATEYHHLLPKFAQ